jgi:hypothetical protein
MLHEITRADRNFVAFSGHVHKRYRFIVDKRLCTISYSRSDAPISKPFSVGCSYFLTASSLAHPQTKDDFFYEPEVYNVSIVSNEVVDISVEKLRAAPLDRFHFSLLPSLVTSCRLEFSAKLQGVTEGKESGAIVHLLVLSPRRIELDSIACAAHSKVELDGTILGEECLARFLPGVKGGIHYCLHTPQSSKVPFVLSNLNHKGPIEVVGIAQFVCTFTNETLRLCWYPRSLFLP